MNPEIKKRLLRTLIFSLIALVIGVGVGAYQVSIQKARVLQKGVSGAADIAGLELGGPFNLTNHLGEAVTQDSYAGKYKLIYFGFTYCPAICPTELQKISQVMKAFEKDTPEQAERLQPLFITIDPARDDVQAMNAYVKLFHPRLVGLTGTQPQIDFIAKAYRVFATKVENEDLSDYTMDHSSFLYFMGPEDQLMGLYRMDDTADFIYKDMVAKISSL